MVLLIREDRLAGSQMKFHVQRMRRALPRLEGFHARRLLYPAFEDAAHTFDCALTQFMGFASVIINTSEIAFLNGIYGCIYLLVNKHVSL